MPNSRPTSSPKNQCTAQSMKSNVLVASGALVMTDFWPVTGSPKYGAGSSRRSNAIALGKIGPSQTIL